MATLAFKLGIIAATMCKSAAPWDKLRPTDTNHVAKLYDAVAAAETGGETNKWIRTKDNPKVIGYDAKGIPEMDHKGSTAWGPVQITADLMRKYTKPPNVSMFTPSETNFMGRFLTQGKKFLHHGNEKGKIPDYDPKFDYGGIGELTNGADRVTYRSVGEKLLRKHLEQTPNTLSAIELWRGTNYAGNPDYFNRAFDKLRRTIK